jgi:hypothetical protein
MNYPVFLSSEALSQAAGGSKSALRRLIREDKYPFLGKRVKLRGVRLFLSSVDEGFRVLAITNGLRQR